MNAELTAEQRALEVAMAVAPQYNDWDVSVIAAAITDAQAAARDEALREAERVCRERAESYFGQGTTTRVSTIEAFVCAAAIAALRAATPPAPEQAGDGEQGR